MTFRRRMCFVMGLIAASALVACSTSDAQEEARIADAQVDVPGLDDAEVGSDAGRPCKVGSLECGADYLCFAPDTCEGEGTCVLVDTLCERTAGSLGGVCGCNGMAYDSLCDAYRLGATLPNSTTVGCKEPEGRFTCNGRRYCDPTRQYCCKPGENYGACIEHTSGACGKTPANCSCVGFGRDCRVIDGGTPGLELTCPGD